MAKQVLKRDGTRQAYNRKKIADAIYKAVEACGGSDRAPCEAIAEAVEVEITENFTGRKIPNVEQVQDIVERHLIKAGYDQVAKAYILYREKRRGAREENALIGATIQTFEKYLGGDDFAIKENANQQKSVMGLMNFVREEFTKRYWLNEVYPFEIAEAHRSATFHIHDLGFFGAYCVGWDVKQILMMGFTGVPGKISSAPPKHFRTALGQICNATFTFQGETAGAQAWSSFDTYLAPFIKYDGLNYKQVKQALQEFVYNMNVATRVGFQCPFSNITLDLKCPKTLANEHVIIGGEPQAETYAQFQEEMDMFNKAFCEIMLAGDAQGRVFSFPIPTINITTATDWKSPVMDAIMEMTCKYGTPYFANFVNSDLDPEDAVSMCCRLRLDVSELRKKGGGLFGSNPLTGSIGVVTINLPRLGYKADNEAEFFENLERIANMAKNSLEIKRKIVEDQTVKGLYPYCKYYLQGIKDGKGAYWANHFSTIGLVGMHECLLNFLGADKGLDTEEGNAFAVKILNFLRGKMQEYQAETGNVYNLEATPGEGTQPRFAIIDKKRYPDIITQGGDTPYYSNSSQMPVAFTDDVFKAVKMQNELQSLYTGGTVLHVYMGERLEDKETAKNLIQKIFNSNTLPYVSLTPTFSVCAEHGYLKGEQWTCPTCKGDTEVWSRVVGFLRPVQDYNAGKRTEYKDRVKYKVSGSCN
ncbi:MAG: ribonucleoside triphosphate reductase [Firmicutes bacterium]|nr:ribonucleoside triphosphate reductase [Bacillota bacterium]